MKVFSAEFLRSAKLPKDYPHLIKPEIAFLGRSNVGKSSLINTLLNRKSIARISSTPGRTRSINYFLINQHFLFVDLPGYGYAKVSQAEKRQWEPMMRAYFKDHPDRVMAILIIDARHEPTRLDIQMWEWLEFYGFSYLVVATKVDKVKKSRLYSQQKALNAVFDTPIPPLFFSAVDHTGRIEVWHHIHRNIERIEAGLNWGAKD